jgi:hypothetical protein
MAEDDEECKLEVSCHLLLFYETKAEDNNERISSLSSFFPVHYRRQ